MELGRMVYRYLLVQLDPIDFERDPNSPELVFRPSRTNNLCPAILSVCRKVCDEAIEFLYPHNRFHLPTATPAIDGRLYMQPFIDRIGSRAGLIRFICINFPHFDWYERLDGHDRFDRQHVDSLTLLGRDGFKDATLELFLSYDRVLDPWDWFARYRARSRA